MSAPTTSEQFAAEAAVSTRGDGATVVLLLHGLGGDRHQPWGLLGEQTDPRLTLIAPDQRAHGETPVVGAAVDFRLDRLADDAATLLSSRGLDGRPIVVVGISMGAAVALRLLQRGTHDLRGGLLIRPAFEEVPWPEHLLVFQEIAALLRAEGAAGRETFLESDSYRHVAAVSVGAAQSLLEQFTKPGSVERVVRLENVPANPSITWQAAWTPPCPVTVVGAEDDPVHPLRVAQLWHERIATANLVRIPSRDRHPDEYAQALFDLTHTHLDAWA